MNSKKTVSILSLTIMFSLIASPLTLGLPEAAAEVSAPQFYADTTGSSQSIAGPNSSNEVGIIGGAGIQFGGSIPTPGGFAYTTINTASPLPSLATACTAGAACDTVILNVASSFVNCNLSGTGSLSAADLATLVAFMQAGGKLIIYDSECPTNDYTWLPNNLQFTTSNPGQLGASGQADVVEENVLSTTGPGGTNPIDEIAICANDACGDANVMLALGNDLCKDMDADNAVIQGLSPTHVYSRSGASSGLGMMIYNGFDYDVSSNPQLQLLTLYELQANFNPHDPSLICGTPVLVGGEALGIDTAALLLAGAQTNAVWLMSALAVIGSVAFGALYITSKKN